LAPSGKQLEIGFGDQRAVIVEVGAGLRTYTAVGREILDGYAADEICSSGRGQLLLPWPNRLEGGAYDFDGRHQLPVDEVTTSSAIHGLVRWANWEIASQTASAVTLQMVLWPRPGYPFSLALEQEYALDGDGLIVRTTATNVGRNRCPFACGAHPYVRLGSSPVDSLTLCVPASAYLVPNERGLPAGKLAVRGTEFDFTQPRPIGATRLDHAFCELRRDGAGHAYTALSDPRRAVE
jgi:aldose 1-epimerase